jgi:pilus assembly protein Flp/PilA
MINMLTAYVVSHIESLKARQKNDEGATAVEYGLMVGLIAVVIIGAVTLIGSSLSNAGGTGIFDRVATSLGAV